MESLDLPQSAEVLGEADESKLQASEPLSLQCKIPPAQLFTPMERVALGNIEFASGFVTFPLQSGYVVCMKSLTYIAPIRAGIVLGVGYGLGALLIVPFFFLGMLAGKVAGAPMNGLAALPAAFAIVIPFVYAALGFIGGIIAAAVYNLIAKFTGGFLFRVEAV